MKIIRKLVTFQLVDEFQINNVAEELTSQVNFMEVELNDWISISSAVCPDCSNALASRVCLSSMVGSIRVSSVFKLIGSESGLGVDKPCEFSARTRNVYSFPPSRFSTTYVCPGILVANVTHSLLFEFNDLCGSMSRVNISIFEKKNQEGLVFIVKISY